MEKTKDIIYISIIVFLVAVIIGIIVYGYDIKVKSDIIISTFEIDERIINIEEQYGIKAEEYYNFASEDYISQDYLGVIKYCEKARDYYLSEGQEYRNLKSELQLKNQNKIIVLYQSLLDEKVIITGNMYEACEYFESASKYYDIYFNTNVDYGDASFDMGGSEIESMNDKIALHDDAVRKHNIILSKINAELLNL